MLFIQSRPFSYGIFFYMHIFEMYKRNIDVCLYKIALFSSALLPGQSARWDQMLGSSEMALIYVFSPDDQF